MPDVGVLNLQIHDNSSTAAEGLGRLAAKLEAVKAATGGVRLGSVATGIKRINDELKNVQPSAIYKLKQLADVLERIGAISGNVGGIRISFGGNSQSVDQIASQMQNARDAAAQATAEFEQIGNRIQEDIERASNFSGSIGKVNEIVQQTGWSAQTTAEQFYSLFNAWNAFRMSNSLNAGSNPFAIEDGSGGSGAEWTYWKDGAIEVEGTVTDAMDSIRLGAGEATLRLTGVVQSTAAMESGFEYVNSTVQEMNGNLGTTDEYAQHMRMRIDAARAAWGSASDEVKEYVARLIGIDKNILFPSDAATNVNTFGNAMQSASDSAVTLQDSLRRDYGRQMVEDLVNASSKADLLKMRIDALKDSLARRIDANTIDGNGIAQATARIQALQADYDALISRTAGASAETRTLSERLSELMFGAEGVKGAFSRMFPTISSLLSRFKQIAKYRILRAVLKQITEGVQEGVENYYYYSQAIGGTFATSMDNAATSLQTMKNAIGASVSPLISSLIPYLQQVVNLFVEAVNYVNQFFSLLNGQSTWSKATSTTTTAFDSLSNSASGASNSIKDLLADWDELNIIQSTNNSSGTGSTKKTAQDYLKMFEETSDFNSTIKDIVSFVKKNADDILTVVEEIGAAILLWKFSNAFAGLLGTLSGLVAAGLTAAIVFKVSTMFNNEYLNTGETGWLIADVLTTMIGAYLMKTILTKILGGQVAYLAIPITLTVSAVAGITTIIGNNDVSALSKESLIASAENALKVAFAAGYLLKHAGYGFAASAGAGLGAGVTTFGLVVGLKAVAQTLDTKEFTEEIVKADFLSAGLVGTGIAISELALGGGAAAALTLGSGAALLTLGALFAIEALIVLSKDDPIQWGDYKATEEEIKSFIDNEVFSGAPKAKISLANATIEELGQNKTSLETAASDMLGTLHSVKLGLKSSAEADLKSDVEEFISAFNQTSKSYQDALTISVALVPVSSEEDGGASIVKNSQSRWTELNGIMTKLANDLTNQFDIAYNGNLDEVTRKNAEASIEKISNMMTQIADAVSSGQAKAKIANGINMQISNLTQDSMDQMLDYYKEQRDALIAELTETSTSAAEGLLAQYYSYQKLAEYALKDAGGNTEDATYQHYLAQSNQAYADYQERIQTIQSDAEAEADKVLGDTEGAKKIRQTLLEKVEGLFPTDQDMAQTLASGGIGDIDLYSEYAKGLLSQIASGETDNSELKNDLSGVLDGILYDLVGGDNVEEYRKAIENGIIGYGDLFGSDFASKLTDALGISNLAPELQAQWQELINEFFPEQTVVADPTTIEVPIGTSLSEGFFGGEETTFELGLETDTINLKDQIQNDLNSMDPVTVPTNADVTVNKSGQQTASAGLASIPLAEIGNAVMTNLTSVFSQLAGENNMFGTITINTERNDEQDTNNIAEGTKRGTVGLESKQSQTNTYMAQAVSYLATIAANSGGGAGVGGSQAGYLITNALNQFAVVSNGVR